MRTNVWPIFATVCGAAMELSGRSTTSGSFAIWLINASRRFTLDDLCLMSPYEEIELDEYRDEVPRYMNQILGDYALGDIAKQVVRIEVETDRDDTSPADPGAADAPMTPLADWNDYVLLLRGESVLDFDVIQLGNGDASDGRLIHSGRFLLLDSPSELVREGFPPSSQIRGQSH